MIYELDFDQMLKGKGKRNDDDSKDYSKVQKECAGQWLIKMDNTAFS